MICRIASCLFAALMIDTVLWAAVAQETSQAARRSPVVEVFQANRDAVVNISSKEIITARDPFGGMFEDLFDFPFREPGNSPRTRQYTRTSVGSGFVLHEDGYIVTNAHVVSQTAERKATFADGREFDAQIIATDTGRDLAVLKIETDRPLNPIKLGRSHDLLIGETVIAIGNPLGYQNTVTAGVVSAIDRELAVARGMTLNGLIQTDASINPGNSGGPLLNVLGELIGINTAIRGDAQNIGFAIPVDQLREVLPELLDVERRYRIVCGMTVASVDGPRITAVQTRSPAEIGGVKTGDTLRAIEGRPVSEGIDFYIALIGRRPNEVIRLDLERNGRPVKAEITLEGRPLPDGGRLASERLGINIAPLTDDVADMLGLSGSRGLIVASVESDGPAARLGLQRRDVLVAVGRHAVDNLDDLGQLLEMVKAGEKVPVTVLRLDRRTKLRLMGEIVAR
jgi:serine protease Do